MQDQLHRYLFGEQNVRGQFVRLEQSFSDMLDAQEFPEPIQRLLGELMVVSSLLTATLKFEGEISVQLQSEGTVNYAVINGTHDQVLRGTARWNGEVPENFSEMFVKGVLVITITPNEGERYQGVVALDKPSLAECVEGYFEQSEQLTTRLFTFVQTGDTPKAAGLFLQVLPVTDDNKDEHMNHLSVLTETASREEVFNLPTEELLYRLYHEQEVELMQSQPVLYKCTCSKERSAAALINVSKEELLDIVKADGEIVMNCQYCSERYTFDAIDVEAIHSGNYREGEQDS